MSSSNVHLPFRLKGYIERTNELAQIKRGLAQVRLVTLTGPGGIGKTSLAIEAASELTEEYDDIFLITLDNFVQSMNLPYLVAKSIGMMDVPEENALELLTESLYHLKILLILDNCEHMVDSCAVFINQILEHTPKVSVLATSREVLRIQGEWILPVSPLSVPNNAIHSLNFSEISANESIQLFLQRAQTSDPYFQLTDTNVASIVKICQKLDGIPLAIELAAALCQFMTVHEILQHLLDKSPIFMSDSRTISPHHKTMDSVCEWTYRLLTDKEKRLWERLSVFQSGFTLAAVCNVVSDEFIPESETWPLLRRLVEKSLVIREQFGVTTRYRMLEPIRDYGAKMLATHGETLFYEQQHYKHYSHVLGAFVDKAAAGYDVVEDMVPFVKVEISNVLKAFQFSRHTNEDEALIMSFPFTYYCLATGNYSFGYTTLLNVLKQSETQYPTRNRAIALVMTGLLALRMKNEHNARALLEQGIETARNCGDKFALQLGLSSVTQALPRSKTDRMQQTIEELIQGAWTWSFKMLGFEKLARYYLIKNELHRADQAINEALTFGVGNENGYCYACVAGVKGLVDLTMDRFASAIRHLEIAHDYTERVGLKTNQCSVLYPLMYVYHKSDHSQKALETLEKALYLTRCVGIEENSELVYPFLVLTERGFTEDAALMIEAVKHESQTFHLTHMQQTAQEHIQYLQESHVQNDSQFQKKRRPLSRQSIVAYLIEQLPIYRENWDRHLRSDPTVSLTKREHSVLLAISTGASNKEVAKNLYLAEGSVRTYLTRLYNKLGVKSRTEALIKAQQLGLITKSQHQKH